MRACLLIFIFCFKISGAQHIADSFQNAEIKGYSMQYLDKKYPSAIGAGNVVFKGDDEKRLIEAYGQMMHDLGKYLNDNGYMWNGKTRIFNRIYFEPDGSISYYLVNLVPTGLDEVKQKAFLALLNKFVQTYKIKITANSRFAQCSPVVYDDIIKT